MADLIAPYGIVRFTLFQRRNHPGPARAATLWLALLLAWPLASAQEPADLEQIRTRAAAADPEAQNALGNAYTNGWLGLAPNQAEALVWYQRAAEKGLAAAQFNLGLAHELGRGVPKDDTIAFHYYLKAAQQGFATALFNVGNMYTTGRGVRQDLFESNVWYRQAADKGVPEAMFNLALAYETGRGIRQDEVQAAHWYRRAADRGFALAQFNLGLLLEDGRGIAKDEAAAARCYLAAAEQGLATAQNNYGLMLHEGRGDRPRNPAESLFWLTLAAEQGVDPLARDTVARSLTPEQTQAAGQLLAAYRAAADKPTAPPPVTPSSQASPVAVLVTPEPPPAAPTPTPKLERQVVAPVDARLVDQLREQVGRLANQVLAVTAEKKTLEEKLATERANHPGQSSVAASPDTPATASRLRQAEDEAIRLNREITALQAKVRNTESAPGSTREFSERIRELEQQLHDARGSLSAAPAGEGSVLAALQQQVKQLRDDNRDLERWVETLEASVRRQSVATPDEGGKPDASARLAETEEILAGTKRALDAQIAREEKLKVENSLLSLRFQNAEELLASRVAGPARADEFLDVRRELNATRDQATRLKREKDELTNAWAEEQRILKGAQERIAALEQELAQAWKRVEAPVTTGSWGRTAEASVPRQEMDRLLREQENAAALLAITRQALGATQEQVDELKAENGRLRGELTQARATTASRALANPGDEKLIASLRVENEQLSARLTRLQGTVDQIMEVVRYGATAPAPSLSTPMPSATRSEGRSARFHIVQDGDSLSALSEKYYGTPNRGEEIFRANDVVLADSKKLRTGQRLLIP